MSIVTSTARNKDEEMHPTPPLQMDLWPQEFLQTLEALKHNCSGIYVPLSCTEDLNLMTKGSGFSVKFGGDL